MKQLTAKLTRIFGRLVTGLAAFISLGAQPVWELSNGQVQMRIEPHGAIISDLRLMGDSSSWLSPAPEPELKEPFAHFLCFDRWGPVTEEDVSVGFNFHGEAARVPWKLTTPPTPLRLEINTTLPLARLRADREIRLSPDSSSFRIQTVVRNPTEESRPFNLVEHITLADSWSDRSIRMITNARRGLLHENGDPVVGVEIDWPQVTQGEAVWDLRQPTYERGRYIAALSFPAKLEWAWVCLQDPRTGALLAYVWRISDMPWLNLYWFANGERIVQRAIEPGTSGLHRPMAELWQTPVALGRPVVHWLDAAAERQFTVWGGLTVKDASFGILTDFRQQGHTWVAVDEVGNQGEILQIE